VSENTRLLSDTQESEYTPALSYLASLDSHGKNQKIALAFFRLTLNNLLPYLDNTNPPKNSNQLSGILYHIFDFLQPKYILGALQHILKKDPQNIYARVWFMKALISFENEKKSYEKDLLSQLDYLQDRTLSTKLALIALEDIYPALQKICDNSQDWQPLFILLHATLKKRPFTVFHQATFDYILLLLQAKSFDHAKNIFYQWKLPSKTGESEHMYQEHYDLAKLFVEHVEHARQVEQADTSLLPDFFSKKGMAWQNICGVDMAFVSRKNFTAWFDISKWLSLMESMKKA